ncbi:superoxide dismutase family protein [Sphingomonas asaccharolytica]|uniref:superoxide dismutase family protein n=1 Tax=Sphingomonas asaccharolytica TaxID=40681 RepID=UPI00083518DB|nr:superoxide dismutase family protein [Sphingomonas asaccharolytica]
MRGLAAMMAVAPVMLAGCTANGTSTETPPVAAGRIATATLMTAAGKQVGKVTVREVDGGLSVSVDASDLPPGMHGAHLHTVGKCEGPDFASAGGHWNPTNMKHGSMNPQGPHEGDMPNLMIGADGRGTLTTRLAAASFDALMDADGAAMVIHAAADDLKTDPSGNSGARVACGVLAKE